MYALAHPGIAYTSGAFCLFFLRLQVLSVQKYFDEWQHLYFDFICIFCAKLFLKYNLTKQKGLCTYTFVCLCITLIVHLTRIYSCGSTLLRYLCYWGDETLKCEEWMPDEHTEGWTDIMIWIVCNAVDSNSGDKIHTLQPLPPTFPIFPYRKWRATIGYIHLDLGKSQVVDQS